VGGSLWGAGSGASARCPVLQVSDEFGGEFVGVVAGVGVYFPQVLGECRASDFVAQGLVESLA
jgi:hypothetical protein